MKKGSIMNEFGETVGRYWYREGQNRIYVVWLGCRLSGYTEEGLQAWADRLEYYLVEE